ncbi:MAG: hypothetical protein J6Z80_05340 [Clostridia bacterium]|nr:hypothetical protein [Clostridia bacterium]
MKKIIAAALILMAISFVFTGCLNNAGNEPSGDGSTTLSPYDSEGWEKLRYFTPCGVTMDDDFEDNEIYVSHASQDASFISGLLAGYIDDIDTAELLGEPNKYSNRFLVTLKTHDKSRVIEVIRAIEENDWKLSPRPVYTGKDADKNKNEISVIFD